jgi:hypothetical protein
MGEVGDTEETETDPNIRKKSTVVSRSTSLPMKLENRKPVQFLNPVIEEENIQLGEALQFYFSHSVPLETVLCSFGLPTPISPE